MPNKNKHAVAHIIFETKYCKLHGFETVTFTIDRFVLSLCDTSTEPQRANGVCNVDRACQTKTNMQSRMPVLKSSIANYTVLKPTFSSLSDSSCCFVMRPVRLRQPMGCSKEAWASQPASQPARAPAHRLGQRRQEI